jgi:hypothetical protein
MLKAVFPEHEWYPWQFKQVPKRYWKKIANQRSYFDWAAKKLNIEKMADWYNVDSKAIVELNGSRSSSTAFTHPYTPVD